MNILNKIYAYLSSKSLYQLGDVTQLRKQKIKGINSEALVRSVADNEIVIEFDVDSIQRAKMLVFWTLIRLKANGYNYFVFDHKGRSPHIHIYNIQGLESIDDDLKRAYKKEFLKKYAPLSDFSLCSNSSLVAMEFRTHFKHHNIKKLILNNSEEISNKFEFDLLIKARENIERIKSEDRISEYDNSWFINWVLAQKEYKHLMDSIIFKNFAILLNVNKVTNVDELLNTVDSNLRDKKHRPKNEILGWLKWSREGHSWFSFSEVKEFFELYGFDIFEEMKKYKEELVLNKKDNRGVSEDVIRKFGEL